MNSFSESRVTRLTGPGESAISVFRFAGDAVLDVVNQCLQLRGSLPVEEMILDKIYFGYWAHDTEGHFREDVVACRIANQAIEVHFHGSQAVANSIQQKFIRSNIPWVANSLGHIDPISELLPSNASSDGIEKLAQICGPPRSLPTEPIPSVNFWLRQLLTSTITQTTAPEPAEALLLQASGVLGDEFERIAALVDSPDSAITQISKLRSSWSYGRFLHRPMIVLLTGEPNVGKSSLVNALLGYGRSLVTSTAGTTRDLVKQNTIIDGWEFQLIDSAGIRESSDALEVAGIAKVTAARQSADIVIQVRSADTLAALNFPSRESNGEESSTFDLRVLNKIDMIPESKRQALLQEQDCDSTSVILTSTELDLGIGDLLRQIAKVAAETMRRPADWKMRPMVFHAELDHWLCQLETALKANAD